MKAGVRGLVSLRGSITPHLIGKKSLRIEAGRRNNRRVQSEKLISCGEIFECVAEEIRKEKRVRQARFKS